MSKVMSFIMHPKTFDIKVWDISGHSETMEHFGVEDTDKPDSWREAHYLISDEIECRFLDIDSSTPEQGESYIRSKWPKFKDFFNDHCPKNISCDLDLRGCDLKGITLPESIGGWLNLRGCDLKGITLPESMGGSLDLSGCDLKGITLPESIGGWLDLIECDLKGITLPESIGGSLDLRGCDLKGITLPESNGNYIDKPGPS